MNSNFKMNSNPEGIVIASKTVPSQKNQGQKEEHPQKKEGFLGKRNRFKLQKVSKISKTKTTRRKKKKSFKS